MSYEVTAKSLHHRHLEKKNTFDHMMILTGFDTGILRNSFQASGSKSPYIFMKLHTDL